MIRLTASATLLGLLATAGSAGIPGRGSPPELVLIEGLHAIAASNAAQAGGERATTQAQGKDGDRGDDNASEVAISKVCNHDNPSAQRSAICPVPNSPP